MNQIEGLGAVQAYLLGRTHQAAEHYDILGQLDTFGEATNHYWLSGYAAGYQEGLLDAGEVETHTATLEYGRKQVKDLGINPEVIERIHRTHREDPPFRQTSPQTRHINEDLARMAIKQIYAIYKTLEDTRDGLLREHTAHREKEDQAYRAEDAQRHRANVETVRGRIQYIDDLLDELEETGPIRRGMED